MSTHPSSTERSAKTDYVRPSRKFITLMNGFRLDSTNPEHDCRCATHVSMCLPRGNFAIPEDQQETFQAAYKAELKRKSKLGLAEKIMKGAEMPLVSDVDLKYRLTETEYVKIRKQGKKGLGKLRKHTRADIQHFVKCYSEIYQKYCSFANDKVYWVVSQRDTPYVVDKQDGFFVKDGWHLVNSNLRTFPRIHQLLRKKLLSETDVSSIFEKLGVAEKAEKIIDEAVISKNAWLLHGSSKPCREPYRVAYVFDKEGNLLSQDQLNKITDGTDASWFDHLRFSNDSKNAIQVRSGLRKAFLRSHLLHDEKNLDEAVEVEAPKETTTNTNTTKEPKKKKRKSQAKDRFVAKVIDILELGEGDEERLQEIIRILSFIKRKRAKKKEHWVEIGETLRNIAKENYDKEEAYLKIWIHFSLKHKVADEKECRELWPTLVWKKGGSMDSLRFWASKDSPRLYYKYQLTLIRRFLMKSANATHHDVCQVIYYLYQWQFMCISEKSNTWLHFRGNHWHETESGVGLRKQISSKVARVYARFRSFCLEMAKRAPGSPLGEKPAFDISDEELKEIDEEYVPEDFSSMADACEYIIKQLKTNAYKNALMENARKEFFYKEGVVDLLNERHDLLCFENGVMDLERKIFREGRPDDYITFSTGVDYDPNYRENPYYPQIMKFLKEVYLTDEMVHYILKERAHSLHGANLEERIFTWLGVGGNGKSKFEEALKGALRDYVFEIDITLFTGKKPRSNEANPHLALGKGKRMCFTNEPEENKKLNMGLLKKLSGRDPVSARKFYQNLQKPYIPQFTITMLANSMPKFPPNDVGTIRRMMVVEHKARFVDKPDPRKKNEFKIDRELSSKMKKWGSPLASLLVEYYYIYKKEGLNPPKEVTSFTKSIMAECDSYDQFFSERLIELKKDDPEFKKAYVDLSVLYSEFKSWMGTFHPSTRLISYSEYTKYIKKKYGVARRMRGKKLMGFKTKKELECDDLELVLD